MTPTARPPRLDLEPLGDRVTPATFVVTNPTDGGSGSLRDVFNQAVATPGADTITFAGPLAGAILDFTSSADFTAGPSALFVPAGSDITIVGSGQTLRRASGITEFRHFGVGLGGKLDLRNLTVTGGLAHAGNGASGGGGGGGFGGAVYNFGTLSVSGCTFYGNTAFGGGGSSPQGTIGGGGGMLGSGQLNGNGGPPNGGVGGADGGFAGGGSGGGTRNGYNGGFGGGGGGGNGADAKAQSGGNGGFGGGGGGNGGGGGPSALNGFGGWAGGNGGPDGGGGGAGLGGAIFNQGGTVVVVNSTFTGNAARGGDTPVVQAKGGGAFGGAIFNLNGAVTLTNSTLAGNTVQRGVPIGPAGLDGTAVHNFTWDVGGLTANQTATVTLANCILSDPVNPLSLSEVYTQQYAGAAVVNRTGPNLVTTRIANLNGSVTGTPHTFGDPQLGPLQDNGGFTPTRVPGAGSLALNAGVNSLAAGVSTDQRGAGYLRQVGPAVDLGAVEAQGSLTTVGRVVVVSGTPEDDTFAFAAGAKTHTIILNGVDLSVRAADADEVRFNGGFGIDSAALTARGTGNALSLWPRAALLAGTGYSAVALAETVTGYGGPTDGAYLIDSAGNDLFVAAPTYALLQGAGYQSGAVGFGATTAYGSTGTDAAYLFGSAGSDVFSGTPTYSFLAGGGFWNTAVGFDGVNASGGGGTDAAYLTDGPGDDYFTGAGAKASLAGPGYFVGIDGFAGVNVYGTNGGTNRRAVGPVQYWLGFNGTWV